LFPILPGFRHRALISTKVFPMGISVQSEIKKLSELITLYSDRLGLFQQSKILEVYSSWASIVGEKQAAHSQLIDIKHHIAVIETDHPGWIQLFNMHQKRILKELKKEFPELSVKGFSFVLRGKEKKTESGLRDLTVEETEKWLDARDDRGR